MSAPPGEERPSAVATGTPGDWRPETLAIHPGIHLPTWVAADVAVVFDEVLGVDWRDRQDQEEAWQALSQAPDRILWDVRERLRHHLVDFMRTRARRSWSREHAGGGRLVALGTLFDPAALTVGCIHPFGSPGGPEMLFGDPARLAQILTAARRPVQIVVAGRAHPADEMGKHQIQRLFRHALDPAFGGRVAFLEDYDLHVARLLVQGCDVWFGAAPAGGAPLLHGLQAAVNGVPHLGAREAWWADGWTGDNGWIVEAAAGDTPGGEAADARRFCELLEDAIVPAFYGRDRSGVPGDWMAFVKGAIARSLPRFSARRMVKALTERVYRQGAASGAPERDGVGMKGSDV